MSGVSHFLFIDKLQFAQSKTPFIWSSVSQLSFLFVYFKTSIVFENRFSSMLSCFNTKDSDSMHRDRFRTTFRKIKKHFVTSPLTITVLNFRSDMSTSKLACIHFNLKHLTHLAADRRRLTAASIEYFLSG